MIERRGVVGETMLDMLNEMARGRPPHAALQELHVYRRTSIPAAHEHLTEEQWERAFEIFEKERGIPEGQQRIVIEHEKADGRIHRHVVWSRIDLENMRAFPDGLERQDMPRRLATDLRGAGAGADHQPASTRTAKDHAPQRAPKSWEMYRGMKTGLDPRDIKAEVTAIFRESENGAEFAAGLEAARLSARQGDRRGSLILDSAGKEHSLARRIDGINTKELNAFMQGVDREALPTVEQARAQYQEKKIAGLEADRDTVRHEIEWEEALAKAAIEKEQRERRFVEPGQERKRRDGREKEWPTDAAAAGADHHLAGLSLRGFCEGSDA